MAILPPFTLVNAVTTEERQQVLDRAYVGRALLRSNAIEVIQGEEVIRLAVGVVRAARVVAFRRVSGRRSAGSSKVLAEVIHRRVLDELLDLIVRDVVEGVVGVDGVQDEAIV